MAGSKAVFLNPSELHPALPIHPEHWQAIITAMQLSDQQARYTELLLRGLEHKEIALVMGISETTIRTHQARVYTKTRTTNRMELAMHVLVVSHQVMKACPCPQY